MMAKLKPCPICGRVPKIGYACGEYLVSGDDDDCPGCGFAFTKMHSSKQQMIDAWNRIANGVTVQKWIPVTERLPDKEGTYLTYTEKERIHIDCFCIYPNHGTQFWVRGNGKVTHWMPLPEPPKGE